MKKATLGRGLDALIPKETASAGFILASIHDVRPNLRQPRKEFDDEAISELSISIKEKGVLQPLIVRRSGQGYEIIAGERRWRAAQKAGVNKVPIIIKEATDSEALELALIENLQRRDLNPIEEATGYRQLIEDFGLTHEDVAARIGKDRSTVTNQLRLLRLPEEAQKALVEGEISAGHARALLSLESASDMKAALDAVRKQKLSVRNTEALVKKMSGAAKNAAKAEEAKEEDPFIRSLADEFKRALSTKVRIVYNNGRGRIEIDYYSTDELERLAALLLENK
ncbi:MAG TPA: ParB/RepB/Spo0J family partition protein [Thermodesulfobacteriota bacterium]|nr:ParB/RepB/Spo0J family partition protein [Thermodesulfobacteriota bacterium]